MSEYNDLPQGTFTQPNLSPNNPQGDVTIPPPPTEITNWTNGANNMTNGANNLVFNKVV